MVFQFFHSFPAQETAWGTSLSPLPPEHKMSMPKMPCLVLSMPGKHTPFADCAAEHPGPNSGKHDIHPALHHSLWLSLQPHSVYLCVSASLVKTAASSSVCIPLP